MDIKLNETTWDVDLGVNDISTTQSESESLAQRLKIKLLTFLGEWFLNTEEYIPYYETVFGKNRPKQSVDLVFKEAILSEPGVQSIISFESTLDNQRVYSLRFTVQRENSSEEVPVSLTI